MFSSDALRGDVGAVLPRRGGVDPCTNCSDALSDDAYENRPVVPTVSVRRD
jgi:hypothetical protein